MKTLFASGLALFALLFAAPAHAGITEGLGHWQGAGTLISLDGQEQGEFTVEVDRVAVDARTVDVHGKITHADGRVITFNERHIASSNGGFLIEGSQGKGGGRCFTGGLCQSYVDAGADTAFATTIALDGPDKLRVLVTTLDHGRAVRFIRQSLTRKQ
jgi:hypothetical protein